MAIRGFPLRTCYADYLLFADRKALGAVEAKAVGLWGAQVEAIINLEQSLAADRLRALMQMATGSGKTVTA